MTDDYSPLKRGSLLIPSGPTDHLHFICCNPVFYPSIGKECVLLVNVSSVDVILDHDRTCILHPADHPFIRHESYVYYRKAEVFGANNISRNVAEGNFQIHQICDKNTFSRILHGFCASDEVRPKIKRFYEKYCQ